VPIYEYRCASCNAVIEVKQSMSDAKLTKCPTCGKNDLNRLISSTSFILKGGGWYATDYGGKQES
jgi:putative FmdB family regulatory protein